MHRPFTLYKESLKSGTFWYARFWDEEIGKYNRSRSTGIKAEGKKERKHEAEEAARKLLAEIASLPPKVKTPKYYNAVIGNPSISISQSVKNSEPVKTCYATTAETPLIIYLQNFWTAESEYVRFKSDVQKKPLSINYIEMNHDDIRRHVEPFPVFATMTVGELNKAALTKYLIWLAGRRKQYKKKDGTVTIGDPISGHRANSILQAVRVAVRWAVDNDELEKDPFHKLGDVTEFLKEKGVLNLEERNRLINLPVKNHRYRLAMLLGCLCGMRRGEMRGLLWCDIEDDVIHIKHNYIDKEADKKPKYNSIRKVPLPTAVKELLEIVRENVENSAPDNYVFESPKLKGKPLSNNFFRDAVKKELLSIGICEAEQKERFITPHSLRHTFITLAQISGIPDVVICALAGHKSLTTTSKYSHVPQVIDFAEAKKKLDASYLLAQGL
jgi:integrase